ncbi:MAG: hypothetical protein U0168_30845 [Nannocystaceae bacterium]
MLGVGAGTSKLTLDEHRAVDVALNQAFVCALRDSGKVQHLAFMSAASWGRPRGQGVSRRSRRPPRYNRVKGESEQAVRNDGLPIVSVFRPAMIIGSQHTPRLLEICKRCGFRS